MERDKEAREIEEGRKRQRSERDRGRQEEIERKIEELRTKGREEEERSAQFDTSGNRRIKRGGGGQRQEDMQTDRYGRQIDRQIDSVGSGKIDLLQESVHIESKIRQIDRQTDSVGSGKIDQLQESVHCTYRE